MGWRDVGGGDMFVGTTGKGRRRDEGVGGLDLYGCVFDGKGNMVCSLSIVTARVVLLRKVWDVGTDRADRYVG